MGKAKGKGAQLEDDVLAFLKAIFEELGFSVIAARKQTSGTQNGFDVYITFLDDDENERRLYFECKDYESTLSWENILEKVLQLESSNYPVDGFITISPKKDLSNINDNVQEKLVSKFEFPIKHWTPSSDVEEIFSLDEKVFERIYKRKCGDGFDRAKCLQKLKILVNSVLQQKDTLKFTRRIEINDTDKKPFEDVKMVTNLDLKLNEVFAEDNEIRNKYHQYRCQYKVYLEGLTDVDNTLRLKIQKWQDNLRLKAERLTLKFKDDSSYTPRKFFHDFFDVAEIELLSFVTNERLDGDKEKLLNGVVFELAAECPLDWRK